MHTFLHGPVRVALANLDVCRRVCDLLHSYQKRGLRPPSVLLQFKGDGPSPLLAGSNCGFFTTPVILAGLVEIRRFTSFFGFKAGKSGRIESRPKQAGDFDIIDLNLDYPPSAVFLSVLETEKVPCSRLEAALISSLTYANKEIAHFTKVQPEVDFGSIVLASFGIDRAMRRLVFDPLRIPFPDLQIEANDT